jgi:alpha-1,6-mannosyltransferase
MKICDVVQFYSPIGGGIRRYLDEKVRHFSGLAGLEHIAIVPSHRDAVSTRYHTRFYEVKSPPLIGSLGYRALLGRRRIISIIEQERPELIEVGDAYLSAWFCLEAARRSDIPIVGFYHSEFPRALGRTIGRFSNGRAERAASKWTNRYIRTLYNRMSATIVASRSMEMVLNTCGIQRIVRIQLGTDTNIFRPSNGADLVRDKVGVDKDAMLLVYVGRLAREKHIRALIHMMNYLGTEPGPSGRYHLMLVGDGELRGYVRKMAHERRDLTWHRYCDSPQLLAAYYTAADLLVHAGQYETFGITSLEAQACGTRVLGVRGGGMDETLEGENPLVMAASTHPRDLAEGVRRIRMLDNSQSPEERRHRIVSNFSISSTFDRLIRFYAHLLDRGPVDAFCEGSLMGDGDELYNPALRTEGP